MSDEKPGGAPKSLEEQFREMLGKANLAFMMGQPGPVPASEGIPDC